MEEEDVKAAARLATAELLMTGCTTSMDFMYFFPHGKHDLMDAEFEAVSRYNIQFFCIMTADMGKDTFLSIQPIFSNH